MSMEPQIFTTKLRTCRWSLSPE